MCAPPWSELDIDLDAGCESDLLFQATMPDKNQTEVKSNIAIAAT